MITRLALSSAIAAWATMFAVNAASADGVVINGSDKKVVADDATFFLAKSHMSRKNYEQALPLLTSLTDKSNPAMTRHRGESLFMRGVCEAHLLDRKRAIASLKRFLEENPDASERLRVGAEHQIATLEQVADGSLLDVRDRMEFSGRRLSLEDSGRITRQQQGTIIAMLDALIDDAEQRENPPGMPPPSDGPPLPFIPGPPGPGNPAPEPEKPDANGPEDKILRRVFDGDPASWDLQREQEFERVLDALKAKYPGGRYAKLAEEYRRTLHNER